MLYRVKLARPLPADRNRPDVLQKRVDYANWFMRHAVVNHSIFETSVDIIYGQQEVTDEQDWERGHIDKYVVSEGEMLL